MNTFIELQHVSFFSEDYPVIRDISLCIPRKKCTTILGPSGCGKSTFLKICAGIYPPDEGRVLLRGEEDLTKMSYKKMKIFRKNAGFVFEDSALWANRTVFDNLSLPLEFHFPRISPGEIREKIFALLEKAGFSADAKLRPEQFSASERKVIAFFRGMITSPRSLFMDEPMQSVDHNRRQVMLEILKEMKTRGCTLLIVTANPEVVSMMADHLILLKNGTLVEAGEFNVVKNTTNPVAQSILKQILGEAASFDTDILNLLGG